MVPKKPFPLLSVVIGGVGAYGLYYVYELAECSMEIAGQDLGEVGRLACISSEFQLIIIILLSFVATYHGAGKLLEWITG